jgi:hypothetical protein
LAAWAAIVGISNVVLFYYVIHQTDRYLNEGGYLLGLVGLNLSVAGFGVTFWQLSRTSSAARAAADAVEQLRDRLSRHDAAKEIAQANYALSIARSHVSPGSWQEVSRRCEDANQALMRIDLGGLIETHPEAKGILGIGKSLSRLVDTIDAALAGKGEYPEDTKIAPALRKNAQILNDILLILQREASK